MKSEVLAAPVLTLKTTTQAGLVFLMLACVWPAMLQATNKPLLDSASPYLQKHASDVINWQLLSTEILEKSRTENRPIFLSSGYLSCYWCYRMQQDSFSNKKLADIVNDNFLPILIDRELLPELDNYLQQFMKISSGAGGWPLMVIMTPEGNPVAGFNYRNADDSKQVLNKFLEIWNTAPERIIKTARQAYNTQIINAQNTQQLLAESSLLDLLSNLLEQANAAADTQYGGFGNSEKYPNWPQLTALLSLNQINPDPVMTVFLEKTLQAMLSGGIRDQIGGGFFRYSTERSWQSPHYEMMLYTQALAIESLLLAGQQFDEPKYFDAVDELLTMISRDFKLPGGFYHSAISSTDTKGISGGYFLWQKKKLQRMLGEKLAASVIELSADDGQILPGFNPSLNVAVKKQLQEYRQQQSRITDNKALTGWNGLLLSAFSQAARYNPDVEQFANVLAQKLIQSVDGKEVYRVLDNSKSGQAGLADRVYLARGLVDWWLLSNDRKALTMAQTQLQQAYDRFYTENGWLPGNGLLLMPEQPGFAMADEQLPSPTALWFDTLWKIRQQHTSHEGNTALFNLADKVAAVRIKDFSSNAFFHASALSSLVRQALLQQNKNQVQQ